MNEFLSDLLGLNKFENKEESRLSDKLRNALSPQHQGMAIPGNINLNNRPRVKMPGGGYQTVYTMSAGIDNGKTALIPRIVNGKLLSEKEAFDHFRKSGEHMGIFHSPEAADIYDEKIHKQMGWLGPKNKWDIKK